VPLGRFAPENLERFAVIHPEGFRDRPPGTSVAVTRAAEDIIVIVAGGPGKHFAVIPTFGTTRAVTRRVEA
jgi:hypothetical protein